MAFDYPNSIGALTQDGRLLFYELLAHNLTIGIRAICSDEEIADAEKVDRMKWINEILHRVTSKIRILRLNEQEWPEEEFWQVIQGWVSQNMAIEPLVNSAVLWSYQSVINSAARS
jgi:hypothetical protein